MPFDRFITGLMPNKKVSVWTTDEDVDAEDKQPVLQQPGKKVRWAPVWIGLASGMLVGGIGLSAILVLFIQSSEFDRSSRLSTHRYDP